MNDEIYEPPTIEPIFHAPLTSNTNDIAGGLVGSASGTISFTSEGAMFTKGFIRYENLPLVPYDWTKSWTITYVIKNTSIGSGYHQISVEIGRHVNGRCLFVYSPKAGGAFGVEIGAWGSSIPYILGTGALNGFNYGAFREEKITWSAIESKFYFYLNGNQYTSAVLTPTTAFDTNAINIGGGTATADNLRGAIRDVKIYDEIV
jgi:hypothetical protein